MKGSYFQSHSGHQLSWLMLSCFYPVPAGLGWDSTFNEAIPVSFHVLSKAFTVITLCNGIWSWVTDISVELQYKQIERKKQFLCFTEPFLFEQASVRVRTGGKSVHWCGAVVISPLHIVTAGHCLQDYTKGAYVIRVGDHDTEVCRI